MPGGSRALPSGRCDTPGRLAAEDLGSCLGAEQGGGGDLLLELSIAQAGLLS